VEQRDVIIIGAGPSGSIASALLKRRGWDVLVLEAQTFPRFSIGESLLAHCLDFVAEAGMIDAVDAAGFQMKNGAAFARGDRYGEFDFGEQFTKGRGTTYHVARAPFDKLLADGAEQQGVEIRYQVQVTAFEYKDGRALITTRDASGESRTLNARFVLDGSGFGRVLPKLLQLEVPSSFPVRQAVFTHIADAIPSGGSFDRNKTLITIHPEHQDVWYWLIPFANGRSSLGVVAKREFFERYPMPSLEKLRAIVAEDPGLTRLLAQAQWDTPARELVGYAASVKAMHGPGFALLGNAAEFLDPIFSSGVTIAMRSSSMASALLDRQLRGGAVDWEAEFARPLKRGVDTFRAYVSAWYDGRFQDVIFAKYQEAEVRAMICSILAGYAWDQNNPFVAHPERRLDLLAQLCARQ
jgi:flavin-dependent dehydrogenase